MHRRIQDTPRSTQAAEFANDAGRLAHWLKLTQNSVREHYFSESPTLSCTSLMSNLHFIARADTEQIMCFVSVLQGQIPWRILTSFSLQEETGQQNNLVSIPVRT